MQRTLSGAELESYLLELSPIMDKHESLNWALIDSNANEYRIKAEYARYRAERASIDKKFGIPFHPESEINGCVSGKN